MVVLQASQPRAEANPFVRLLGEAIARQPAVERLDIGVDNFWRGPRDEDVLHLHWPHVLFNWDEPTQIELQEVGSTLDEWAEQCVIVSTFHDPHPHSGDSPAYQALYQSVFDRSQGIIHMGEASKMCFAQKFERVPEQVHEIIPHGTYDCFPNNVDRKTARSYFGLNSDSYVVLVFSGVRRSSETNLLLKGFSLAESANKRLLIASSLSKASRKTFDFYKQWIHLHLDPRIIAKEQFVPDERVQYYLNAADVLVIPKKRILNSGNVALGFTFGKVVVGPKVGVVGEILSDTGNPTFDPSSPTSFADAVDKAKRLASQKKGDANLTYASKYMDWGSISKQHLNLYSHLS